jgi:AraC-like DNA-binding protein
VIHLIIERGRSEVVGIMRTRFTRRLEGRGRVVATRFRPGGFRPFVSVPIATLTGKTFPLSALFGRRAKGLEDGVLAHEDDRGALQVLESFLRGLTPEGDPLLTLAGRIVARVESEPGLRRVDDLVREFAMPRRRLQRLFREYVGASPKWVILRYRLLDAAERIATGEIPNFADLALELGYSDQPHFIRDFKSLVGRTPSEYIRGLDGPGWAPVRP